MNTARSREARPAATILVLDDDPQLLNASVRALSLYGYRPVAAASAAEALRVAVGWAGSLDLLVCDLVLPGLSGREAASAIQARHPAMKVLFMSGYSSSGSFRRDLQECGESFLGKPFEVADLLAAVDAVLAGRKWPERREEAVV